MNEEQSNIITLQIQERPLDIYKTKLKSIKLDYPQPQNDKAKNDLPKLFANYLFVGSRGCGKTTSAVRLLKEYQENKMMTKDGSIHPVRIIWVSPTGSSSSNQNILKNIKIEPEDFHEEYTEGLLDKIIQDIERVNEEVMRYKLYVETYNLIDKTPENKIPELLKRRPEIVDILKEYDYKKPDEIDIKYKERPISFLVLDDLVGSDAFNKKATSKLLYYFIKNRHYFLSFMVLVQALKNVNKPLRQNTNYFYLSKCASKKYIINDLFDEVSNVLDEDTFVKLYEYATQDQYGALVIDFTGSEKKFYKSLDKELILIK